MLSIIVADIDSHVQHATLTLAPSDARGHSRTPGEVAGVFDSGVDEDMGTRPAPQTADAPDRLSDDPQTPAPPVIDECPF